MRLSKQLIFYLHLIILSLVFIPVSPSYAQDEQAWTILNLLNADRNAAGLHSLTMNTQLVAAAQRHSNDMANGDFLSHTGSDGSEFWERIADTGYSMTSGAENILFRWDLSATEAYQQWWNSPGHYNNMMNANYVEIGIAWAQSASGKYYYTMVLATRPGVQPPPIPPTSTPVPPTSTPIPPTSTPIPPTSTPIPPTSTPIPPTSTPVLPTNTPIPPTSTPMVIPTSTPMPTITIQASNTPIAPLPTATTVLPAAPPTATIPVVLPTATTISTTATPLPIIPSPMPTKVAAQPTVAPVIPTQTPVNSSTTSTQLLMRLFSFLFQLLFSPEPADTAALPPAMPILTLPPAPIPTLTLPPPPMPTLTLPPTATIAPIPTTLPIVVEPDIRLIYNAQSLTLLNVSGDVLDLRSLSFSNGFATMQSEVWNIPDLTRPLSGFPNEDCLQVWGVNEPFQAKPAECRFRHAWVTVGEGEIFWRGAETFWVSRMGTVIGVCDTQLGVCDINLTGGATATIPTANPNLPASVGGNIDLRLIYDERSFSLINVSGFPIDLTPLSFESRDGTLAATRWDNGFLTAPLNTFPTGDCLQVWSVFESTIPNKPDACNFRHAWIAVGDAQLFWRADDLFRVVYAGQVIATCSIPIGLCDVAIP